MYPIDLVVMDDFHTYTNYGVDDVQVFGATYYDFSYTARKDMHALCINYKANTGKVHVYDSGNTKYLEGRQKGIIQKLYPDIDIEFEKSTALQVQFANELCFVRVRSCSLGSFLRYRTIKNTKINDIFFFKTGRKYHVRNLRNHIRYNVDFGERSGSGSNQTQRSPW